MKAKLLVVIAVLSICITSCQKELSFDDNGGPVTGSSGDLLSKIVGVSGTDMYTTSYEYDSEKRLIGEQIIGITQGSTIDNDLKIIRNSSGIITEIIEKSQVLVAQGIDSTLSIVYYNSATKQYTAVVKDISVAGFSAIDSISFVYGTDGRVSRQDEYLVSSLLGPTSILSVITEFSYGVAGIVEMRQSSNLHLNIGDPPALISVHKYTYDTKINPLIIPNAEAAVLLRTDYSATANATNYEYTDVSTGGANNFQLSVVFTYNSKNKPSSAISTQTPGDSKTTFTYFYK